MSSLAITGPAASATGMISLGFHPDAQELVARARAITPIIRELRQRSSECRDLAPEIVNAIREAGLFKLYQPKQWDGYEADPRLLYAVQNVFAESCASTAWVYGVLSVQSFLLALFDPQAQADVWGDDSHALASSSFMPVGKVEHVEGGYRLSGRWSFSSGSSHAQWVLLGGLVPPPPGDAGQRPTMRLFLVPRSDYETVDTWHTIGLRATGSNDIVVDGAFVPAYRTLQPDAGMLPSLQGADRPALYRLPWLYIFTSTVSNLGIGVARGALDAFIGVERKRISSLSGKAAKEDPAVQRVAGRARAEIAAVETMYNHHIACFTASIDAQRTMALDEGLLYRTQLTSALRKLAALVDEMQLLLGGRGIYTSSPLTPFWLDMCAARAHPGNDPAAVEISAGQMLLSVEE